MKKILMSGFIVFLVFFHFQFVCAQPDPTRMDEKGFINESKKELKNGEPDKDVKKEDTPAQAQEPQNTVAPSTIQESIAKPESEKKIDQPEGIPAVKGTDEKKDSILIYLKEYLEVFSWKNYILGLFLFVGVIIILIIMRAFKNKSKLNKKYYPSYRQKSGHETTKSSNNDLTELNKKELVKAHETHFEPSQEKTELDKEALENAQKIHFESSQAQMESKISTGMTFFPKTIDNIQYNRNPSNDGRACFEVFRKCMIKKNGVTVDVINKILRTSLSKHYPENKIDPTLTGLTVKANLKSMWERAITNAEASIKIEEDQLLYKVTGTTSIGALSWVWLILGLFTGFFLGIFLLNLIEYIICRDRPKKYFEEAFNAVEFEIG